MQRDTLDERFGVYGKAANSLHLQRSAWNSPAPMRCEAGWHGRLHETGAVGNLTKGMATDWAKYGLNCNAIAPGYFDTPLNAALVADPTFSGWLEKRTPAGRWGRVEELQGACIFLASDAASFVNGHILYVDGGITASL